MKEILVTFLLVCMICTGCAGIQFKSPAQEEIINLTVSVAAKAIGLRLAANGFIWTREIETFYNMIKLEDTISLDAAQMAQSYIQANVDPLLAPDLIKLASMVGFEFKGGSVSSTMGVNAELLMVAADGFRLAILAKAN